ncbi:hypothetical protein [Endozoicomonas sp. GU-1]|uniref:hypothetical protein n=1 Tax=Endozoicomonas sp. GU-1 TaxID=3009078 RepID=UPI0022B44111|nr:hypothetical protein [Endozoicomonas sp. GU-1]WBA83354.1 hypothetical protein O2T12_09640 [Endozoicomonas sp. GU-1]WBA86285.1 hypothetical protein O3276_24305 [Endozoicomonas sp. GU-1]
MDTQSYPSTTSTMINGNSFQASSPNRFAPPAKSREKNGNFQSHNVDIPAPDKTTKKINTASSPAPENPVNFENNEVCHAIRELMERKLRGETLSGNETRMVKLAKELLTIHEGLKYIPEVLPANDTSTPYTHKTDPAATSPHHTTPPPLIKQ